jgi:hypothetical protein
MATTAYRNRQPVCNRSPQCKHDVVFIRAHNDCRRPSINRGIPHAACRFVGGILRPQERAVYLPDKITSHARECTLYLRHLNSPQKHLFDV